MEDTFDGAANSFTLSVGLPPVTKMVSAAYLVTTPDEIRRMTGDECQEAAVLLQQDSFRLQLVYNAEEAKRKWAEERVRKLIAPFLSEVRAYSWEEKRSGALLAAGIEAETAEKIRVKSQARADHVCYLGQRLDAMAKTFQSMAIQKRGMS